MFVQQTETKVIDELGGACCDQTLNVVSRTTTEATKASDAAQTQHKHDGVMQELAPPTFTDIIRVCHHQTSPGVKVSQVVAFPGLCCVARGCDGVVHPPVCSLSSIRKNLDPIRQVNTGQEPFRKHLRYQQVHVSTPTCSLSTSPKDLLIDRSVQL